MKIKAILIDPEHKRIKEVQIERGLKGLYDILDCSMVEIPVHYDNGDAMYSNEEAWLEVDPKDQIFGFEFPDWDYPILGKSLIVGTDDEGQDINCRSTIDDFKDIIWRDNAYMRHTGIKIGMI
jgi:hypothetical protein